MSGSEWGFEWGEYWGDSSFSASSRLLNFVRNTTFSALVDTFADRTEDLIDVSVEVATAFDLDAAVGVQLDRLGEILQLPRYGYADDRYRVLLQIQAQLVLSSTTTTAVILRIVELFTGHAPTSYADAYPMAYIVGAQLDDPADAALLLELLHNATAAAYGFSVITSEAGGFVLDFEGDPIDGASITDFEGNPIADAGLLGYQFTP